MPEKRTVARAKQDLKAGKSASTAAGEFVHQEIEHVRRGQHGARSAKQAIAIGLSEARRAGVPVGAPKNAGRATRKRAERDTIQGKTASAKGGVAAAPSPKRRKAARAALEREPAEGASRAALSKNVRATRK